MEKIQCIEEEVLIKQVHHSPTQEIAQLLEERLVFYMYPQAEHILKTFLIPRFQRAEMSNNDRGLIYFVYGNYHTGKSFLLKYYAALMKRCFPAIWKNHEFPILKIDLNNHINTAEQLLLFILEKLFRIKRKS